MMAVVQVIEWCLKQRGDLEVLLKKMIDAFSMIKSEVNLMLSQKQAVQIRQPKMKYHQSPNSTMNKNPIQVQA